MLDPKEYKPILPADGQVSYGWMQGAQAALQDKLALADNQRKEGYLNIAQTQSQLDVNKDIREEKRLGMEQEAFGWKREDRQQAQAIQQGMAEAFQQGGYSGVIDFLQNNDPTMAIDFTNKKLALDKNIMQNDVMQTLVPSQQAAALAEGYKVIGQMGGAILKAPEQDRDAMYQQLYPIIQKINPNAPSYLNEDAQAMLMLGISQAMPANIFYQNQKQQVTSQTALGKLDVDIKSRLNAGETIDNSPVLASMIKQYQNEQQKLDGSSNTLNGLTYDQLAQQTKANGNQYGLISKLSSDYNKESKSFNEFIDNKARYDGAISAITNGAGAAAETAAYRQVAMMFNKGALSDVDVAAFANSDNTLQVALKKLRSVDGENGMIALNPSEIQRLNILMDHLYEKVSVKQQKINDRYTQYADRYNINRNDLPLQTVASPDAYLDPSVPPELAAQAKDAIQKGADRNAVNARIKQLMDTTAQSGMQVINRNMPTIQQIQQGGQAMQRGLK